MTVTAAWLDGIHRVRRAPSQLVLLWLLTIAVTLAPAYALQQAMRAHLDASLEAETAASGVNYDWLQEFRAQAGPLGRSLRPDVIGFAAVMDNASAMADAAARPPVVIVTGLIFLAATWFLSPGIICRLAANRPLHADGFLGCCGLFLFRMLRLNLAALIVYGTLFGSVHQWLFDDLYDVVTHNLTVERTAFMVRATGYVCFFLVVAWWNLLVDFAKVRMVVEDRQSVIGALAASAHFVANNFRLAAGVYATNVLALAVVVAVYAVVAPGAGGGDGQTWMAFGVGQMYVAARLAVKLSFWSSEASALQGRLAYAGFVRKEPRFEVSLG